VLDMQISEENRPWRVQPTESGQPSKNPLKQKAEKTPM
jgi:hypothetical protein